ncbi:MAG: heavy-metal-associated domain-containing protein [bacterium]|nr:heavy-metal-associated domain-containing protein [bacterium]
MKELKFKTNIKCTGCINTVTPHLDKTEGITNWSVDLEDPNRTLTVNSDESIEAKVITAIQDAGYEAERV